jgi:ATP phosphoribosyltransferase
VAGREIVIKTLKVQDISVLLREGLLDFGVCSDEWMAECRVGIPPHLDLGWCRTRIVFATSETELGGDAPIRVATPYPNLAHSFLERYGWPYRVLHVLGCPEALVPDSCDGLIDCVETGRSLRDNGLLERDVLLHSTVSLYAQPHRLNCEVLDELAYACAGVETRGASPAAA